MPTVKEARRRHSRPGSQPKSLTPPSTLSVLSTSTSGSNSTVTPDPPFRSSLRPSKRFDPKKSVAKEPGAADGGRKGNTENHSDKENLNVFSFMEKEGQAIESESESDEEEASDGVADEDASTTSAAPTAESPSPQPSKVNGVGINATRTEGNTIWRKGVGREGSLHSDSGISVRSSSPERDSPIQRHKHPAVRRVSSSSANGPAPAYPGYYAQTSSPDTYASRSSAYPRDWSTSGNLLENPEAYYGSTRPVVTQTLQRARVPPPEAYGRHSQQLVRASSNPKASKPKPNKSGYDALASAIDSQDDAFLKPIYRKFETLNHRILLYLQDEISEMEGDLRELDKGIQREDELMGKTHASRRAEAKLPSQLQWRRLDLLGRSYTKVEQYNRALSSYSNLTKSLEPASQADIDTYRKWIAEHAPMVEQEAAFLQTDADLVVVTPHNGNSPLPYMRPNPRSELETHVIIVAFTLVSTIIVFKVVPRILARLVISTIVGVASLCTLSPSVLSDPKSIRHWGRGIAIYTAVMLVLAIVVS